MKSILYKLLSKFQQMMEDVCVKFEGIVHIRTDTAVTNGKFLNLCCDYNAAYNNRCKTA